MIFVGGPALQPLDALVAHRKRASTEEVEGGPAAVLTLATAVEQVGDIPPRRPTRCGGWAVQQGFEKEIKHD